MAGAASEERQTRSATQSLARTFPKNMGDAAITRFLVRIARQTGSCSPSCASYTKKGDTGGYSGQSFRKFEQAGWESSRFISKYHEHLSGVTTQSTSALLDAAGVGKGARVLDVATGGGYVAAAAAHRGGAATGIDFSLHGFVWRARHTPRCASSRLMQRRCRSSLERLMRSSTASVCVERAQSPAI